MNCKSFLSVEDNSKFYFPGNFLKIQGEKFRLIFNNSHSSDIYREYLKIKRKVGAILLDCPFESKACLIRQFRYPVYEDTKDIEKSFIYEIVAGLVDNDESIEQSMIRESKEETGLDISDICSKIENLGEFYMSPGITNEKLSIFRAVLTETGNNGVFGVEEEGEIIYSYWLPYKEIRTLYRDGLINDAKTVISLLKSGII